MESRPLGQGRGELLSHPDEIGQRRGLHLPHDLAAMDLDGFLGRAKLAGDLLVQKALDDEREDLTFAWRQGLIASPQSKELLLVLSRALATRDTLRDRVEQLLIVERLGEELQRASLHGSDRHRDVTAPGYEHNRQFKAQPSQFCLELQPAEIRQVNIKHQAVGILQSIRTQTLRRGAERLHLKAGGANRPRQRHTDRHVVVDDEDPRRPFVHTPSIAAAGRAKRTVVPKSAFEAAQSRPPNASTMPRQIARPMPMPSAFVVKNGSKSRSRYFGSIPTPASATATSTCNSLLQLHAIGEYWWHIVGKLCIEHDALLPRRLASQRDDVTNNVVHAQFHRFG